MPEEVLEDLMIAEVANHGNVEGVMPGQMPGLDHFEDDVPDLPPTGAEEPEDDDEAPEDDEDIEAAVCRVRCPVPEYTD